MEVRTDMELIDITEPPNKGNILDYIQAVGKVLDREENKSEYVSRKFWDGEKVMTVGHRKER